MKFRDPADFTLECLKEEQADIDYLINRYEQKLADLRAKREQVLSAQNECRNLLKETDC